MKLLVFVINQSDQVQPILKRFEKEGYHGATVIASRGMGDILSKYFGGSLLGSLYSMMEPNQEENKTVFMVLDDDDVPKVIELIEAEIGSFDLPNRGIAFTIPIDFVKGVL